MALQATLYRFRIDLSDIDRGYYAPLDFRVAMHPSESGLFLMTRVIAYLLNHQEGLEFTPGGLSDADEPGLRGTSLNGTNQLWIEIGHPSMRKLNKAAKASPQVKIYTYKDPESLLKDMRGTQIHKADSIAIYSLKPEFLQRLQAHLGRDNRWSVIHNQGTLMINIGEQNEQGEVTPHSLL